MPRHSSIVFLLIRLCTALMVLDISMNMVHTAADVDVRGHGQWPLKSVVVGNLQQRTTCICGKSGVKAKLCEMSQLVQKSAGLIFNDTKIPGE